MRIFPRTDVAQGEGDHFPADIVHRVGAPVHNVQLRDDADRPAAVRVHLGCTGNESGCFELFVHLERARGLGAVCDGADEANVLRQAARFARAWRASFRASEAARSELPGVTARMRQLSREM